MTAIVHAGRVQRWCEQLCRLAHVPLRVVTRNGFRLSKEGLPGEAGVYAFWWTGPLDPLRSSACTRDLVVAGPGGREIEIRFDDEWLGLEAGPPIPLYVGKTGAIRKRVNEHLLLARPRTIDCGGTTRKAPRPTT